MMTNAAAARLAGPADNAVLWETATLTQPAELGKSMSASTTESSAGDVRGGATPRRDVAACWYE